MNEVQQLAKQAIKGDEDAFIQLIHTYKIDLYRTAIYFLKDEVDALEAIQEITFRAYKNIRNVREPQYIKTWLIRLMINYCHDQLKHKKRIYPTEDELLHKSYEDDYLYLEVNEALGKLDERSKEMITLKYLHDLTIKEIAEQFNRPEGTIKTWLYKGLRSLKDILQERGGHDD